MLGVMHGLAGSALLVCAFVAAACGSGGSSSDDLAPLPEAGEAQAGTGGTGSEGGSGTGGGGGTAGTGGVPVDAPVATCDAPLPAADLLDPGSAGELALGSDPGAPGGIWDPSPVYGVTATSGMMSYSAYAAKNDIRTRVAVSSDHGATWTYASEVNAPRTVTTPLVLGSTRCLGGSCTGQLIHEVSSLIDDSSDAARRYKVFVHSYLVTDGDVLEYDLGFIGLYTAADLAGPWTDEGNVIGWKGEGLISEEGAGTLAAGFPATSACVALTEPAALLVSGGIIDLGLGCAYVEAGEPKIKIVTMRSFDHGKKFSFTNTLFTADDGPCLGGTLRQVNGAHLFTAGGKRYVVASPAGPIGGGFDGYRGCAVMEVESSGSVRRDADGLPIVLRRFDRADQGFIGACAYAEGATAMGYLVPMLRLDVAPAPRVFRLFPSGVAAP